MIEEREYIVNITLTTTVQFSPIERATPITRQDAISNALGFMPDKTWKDLEDAGFAIESEAHRM